MVREVLDEEVLVRRSQPQKDLGERRASAKVLRWK